MTKTVDLGVAATTLGDLIAGLKPNEEVVIVRNRQPVARILASKSGTPQFGNCKGLLTVVEEDDEHLKDFENYMP